MIKYFDNAATTRLDEGLLSTIKKYSCIDFYNPSALSCFSTDVAKDIAEARASIAHLIGANEQNEITFTSCGTESDNTAMFGCLRGIKGNIITSKVEHAAVYNAAMQLKSKGIDVRFVDLLPDGRADPSKLNNLIDKDTQYVCLMHVNNETGAINDIKQLCSITKSINKDTLFLCDGVQAFGKIPINVKDLNVDFYTASGHKINAPKGIGLFYHKKNAKLNPYIIGGGQENGIRSGTENVANIIAFSQAAKNSIVSIENSSKLYNRLKNTILEIVNQNTSDFYCLCDYQHCSPNIITLMFKNIKTEVLLHMMESENFVFGTGSACSSKNKTSRIISALNIPKEYSEGMVRISFDKYSTIEDATAFAYRLSKNVNSLRNIIRI